MQVPSSILIEARNYADKVLAEQSAELEKLVDELMKKGILSQVELERIFADSEVSDILSEEGITESAEIVTK